MVLLFVVSLIGSYVVFKSINWALEKEQKKREVEEVKKKALKIKEKVKRAKRKKV